LLIEIAMISGPCGLAASLTVASVRFSLWRRARYARGGGAAGPVMIGRANPESASDQNTAASACAQMPAVPAMVSAAIRQNRLEAFAEIRWCLTAGSSHLLATKSRPPLTRVIPRVPIPTVGI
jgi:hypothetical protein